MKNSILWLRGAREMLGLQPFSEAAEVAYFDVVNCSDDEAVLSALRNWLREFNHFPAPHELRSAVGQMNAHLRSLSIQELTQVGRHG